MAISFKQRYISNEDHLIREVYMPEASALYDHIVALLPELSIGDLSRLELEIRRRIGQQADGHQAKLRAAIDSLPSFGKGQDEL
jgi:hypothetical protein